ncbi:MAG: C1 family peptidase [Candidatus Altiarchaeota archaeon]|nr:C1 family peptidase [Candidatus Altiarchaeota archaeon]
MRSCSHKFRLIIGLIILLTPSLAADNIPYGSFTVSPGAPVVGETISITVTGNDDVDVKDIAAGYDGTWHFHDCLGTQTSCTHTWTITESSAGTYQYCGYVRDNADQGNYASPGCIDVQVSGTTTTTTAISCDQKCREEHTAVEAHGTCAYSKPGDFCIDAYTAGCYWTTESGTSCTKNCYCYFEQHCDAGGKSCENGVCVEATTTTTIPPYCTDTDGGKDYYVYGECTDSRGAFKQDTCYNGKLYEYYCFNKECTSSFYGYTCPAGYICQNGACTLATTTTTTTPAYCTDTDASGIYPTGRNIYVKGTATDTDESQTDSCSSSTRVLERWCRDGKWVEGYYVNCPNGYECQNGACKPATTTTTIPTTTTTTPPTCSDVCVQEGYSFGRCKYISCPSGYVDISRPDTCITNYVCCCSITTSTTLPVTTTTSPVTTTTTPVTTTTLLIYKWMPVKNCEYGCCEDKCCLESITTTTSIPEELSVSITSPEHASSFRKGDVIFFNSSATGGTPPYTYEWKYMDAEGGGDFVDMGDTRSFSRDDLPGGSFQITLVVTDATGSANSNIFIVVKTPLTVSIISPSEEETFVFLDKIHFEADKKGPYDYEWTSDIDGVFGYNSPQVDVFDELSEGDHTITLTILDYEGYTATDSITITVLQTTTKAGMKSPEEGDIFGEGDRITFEGLAHGTPPYTYSWASNIKGDIGDSKSFSRDDLSVGHHTITLTITDGAGAIATKSVEIIVAKTTFDWRDYNGKDWMTSVKNQQGPHCQRFARVGVMEARYNIQTNNPSLDLDLSEQYLISCWHSDECFLFIKNNGITDEECFPRIGGSDTIPCPEECVDGSDKELWNISDYHTVGGGREAMKDALVNNGPLSVGLFMSGEFAGNVYRCKGERDGPHTVIITGYSDTGNYWIVKNSWGEDWNDDGYFNVGYGECEIDGLYTSYYIDRVIPPT